MNPHNLTANKDNVMKYASHSSKGFTLIELMIVVVILGILAAVAVPAYFNHILGSRQADAYHNMLDIKAAQELYYSLENEYAGPYTPFATANTLTKLLSFTYADTKYFRYSVATTASGSAFVALAEGKFRKLAGNEICISDDYDPCMVPDSGSLKQSLGLEDCPPPSGWPAPFDSCP